MRADNAKPDRQTSSSAKALSLLTLLTTEGRAMGAADLAQAANLDRSTTYRLCKFLTHSGWIRRVPPDATSGHAAQYTIGPRLLGLSMIIEQGYDAEKRLKPIIQDLAERADETVHLGLLDGAEIITIARAFPRQGPSMAQRVGTRQPAYLTAIGKALLAQLSEETLLSLHPNELLPSPLTPNSLTTRAALVQELEQFRHQGYASEDEESRLGVRCVAVAMFDASSQPLFGISITSAPSRLEGSRREEVVEMLKAAGRTATQSFTSTSHLLDASRQSS